MKRIVLVLVLVISIVKVEACYNVYYSFDKNGKTHQHQNDDLDRAFNKNFNAPLNEKRLISTEARLRKSKSYKDLSDYSVRLTKVGKYKESLEILKVLAKDHPNEYQIIANLGTSYELNGQLDSALKYIRKGLFLNPNSHDGSEWVHERILITKIELKKNPQYLETTSILQISESDKGYDKYAHQILVQVRERMPYCPPNNQIMQHLLIELGDVFVNSNSIRFGISLFEIARYYYNAPSAIITPKIKSAKVYYAKAIKGKKTNQYNRDGERPYDRKTYQMLLDDNNPSNYKVNWSKVNTNVSELLGVLN